MYPVTVRANKVKQPWGGYIKPSAFTKTEFDDGTVLHESENVHAPVVGLAVDYLTRFLMTGDVDEAFRTSMIGYYERIAFLSRFVTEKEVKKSGIRKHIKKDL